MIIKGHRLELNLINPTTVSIIFDDTAAFETINAALLPHDFEIVKNRWQPHHKDAFDVDRPDVIILDFRCTVDSLAICKEIRATSQAPIIIIANANKQMMSEKVLDAGGDEYLMKPFSVNILVAYINTFARRARAERQAAIVQKNAVQVARSHRV